MNAELTEGLEMQDYPVKISFDDEDKLFVAEFLDLPGCSAVGATVGEAYARAQQAKEEWIRIASEQGLPIPRPSYPTEHSGRILLRMPASLHAMLSDRAQLHGASLNQFIVHLLSSAVVADEVSDKINGLSSMMCKIESRVAKLTEGLSQCLVRASQPTFSVTTDVVRTQAYYGELQVLGDAYHDFRTGFTRRLQEEQERTVSLIIDSAAQKPIRQQQWSTRGK